MKRDDIDAQKLADFIKQLETLRADIQTVEQDFNKAIILAKDAKQKKNAQNLQLLRAQYTGIVDIIGDIIGEYDV